MNTYEIYQVDAFTRRRFYGNPAGVVPHAEGLTEDQMQRIARELNNSETAFIFPSQSPEEYDVQVRFFTPTKEVPLCGHATIASHYVRALRGEVGCGRTVQKSGAGLLPVDIVRKDGDFAVVMTQGKPEVQPPLPGETVDRIAQALGVTPADLRPDCPVAIASTGSKKVMVALKEDTVLHGLHPNMDALIELSHATGSTGFYVFTLHPGEEILLHGRMFGPANGIPEDPVTGVANGPVGCYLVHYGICRELESANALDFTIMQGETLRRDGVMGVHIETENHQPVLAQITGEAVVAFQAEISL